MKVLVCGGREYDDRKKLRQILSAIHTDTPIAAIIHGGASGADRMAGEWARHNGLPEIRVDANWTRYGKKAGPVRNQWMIDLCRPDFVVAFPGGRGTQDMIEKAKAAGIPGRVIAGRVSDGNPSGAKTEGLRAEGMTARPAKPETPFPVSPGPFLGGEG